MAQNITVNITNVGYSSIHTGANNPNAQGYDSGNSSIASLIPWIHSVSGDLVANTVSFVVEDNTSSSIRTGWVYIFGNSNNTTMPNSILEVTQTEDDFVDVKITNEPGFAINQANNIWDNLAPNLTNPNLLTNNGPKFNNLNHYLCKVQLQTNPADEISNPASGQTLSLAEILKIEYYNADSNGNQGSLVFTQDDPSLPTNANHWLQITDAAVVNSIHELDMNIEANVIGGDKRFAKIIYNHYNNSAVYDWAWIEQDIGYDPNIHTAFIKVENTSGEVSNTYPQSGANTNGDWVEGDQTGTISSPQYGDTQWTDGRTVLLDYNISPLIVEALVETNSAIEPLTPLISKQEIISDTLGPVVPSSLSLQGSNVLPTPGGDPDIDGDGTNDYNWYTLANYLENNTIGDKKYEIKLKHPLNTTTGYDDTLNVVQKAIPMAWFGVNEVPDEVNYTYNTGNTSGYYQVIHDVTLGNYGYHGGGMFTPPGETVIDITNGATQLEIPVFTTSNKAPLVQMIQGVKYDDSGAQNVPGVPNQSAMNAILQAGECGHVDPSGGSNFFEGGGTFPSQDVTTGLWDSQVWPATTHSGVQGVGGIDNGIMYQSYLGNAATQHDVASGSFVLQPPEQQLDPDHGFVAKLEWNVGNMGFHPTNTSKYWCLRYGVWHHSKVDWSGTTPQPIVPFDPMDETTYPDDAITITYRHSANAQSGGAPIGFVGGNLSNGTGDIVTSLNHFGIPSGIQHINVSPFTPQPQAQGLNNWSAANTHSMPGPGAGFTSTLPNTWGATSLSCESAVLYEYYDTGIIYVQGNTDITPTTQMNAFYKVQYVDVGSAFVDINSGGAEYTTLGQLETSSTSSNYLNFTNVSVATQSYIPASCSPSGGATPAANPINETYGYQGNTAAPLKWQGPSGEIPIVWFYETIHNTNHTDYYGNGNSHPTEYGKQAYSYIYAVRAFIPKNTSDKQRELAIIIEDANNTSQRAALVIRQQPTQTSI